MTKPTSIRFESWARWSLLSLLIVACLGLLMRYKIAFSFPYLNQKYLLHAHSHFAFTAWISQAIFLLLIRSLYDELNEKRKQQYKIVLRANLLISFGMLIAFAAQGYGIISSGLATLSILVFLVFCGMHLNDQGLSRNSKEGSRWWKASFLFGLISLIGTANLIRIMLTHSFNQSEYLASLYAYLHFQYNGWFFFALIGIYLQNLSVRQQLALPKSIFLLFVSTCIPAYGLSVLWSNPSPLFYSLIVAAAIGQLLAWILLLQYLNKKRVIRQSDSRLSFFLYFVLVAATIKFLLQAVSVIPAISQLAFGFRPIVIAYLHLVLLAFLSVSILYLLFKFNFLQMNQAAKKACILLLGGIFLNEAMLGIQGIASFSYTLVPHTDKVLVVVSSLMVAGALGLLLTQMKQPAN